MKDPCVETKWEHLLPDLENAFTLPWQGSRRKIGLATVFLFSAR